MLEATVFLKVLAFFKGLARSNFKLFVIFVLAIFAGYQQLQLNDLHGQNAALFETLQSFKDRMIQMKEDHNKENTDRLVEISEIWKSAYMHERIINENTRKIQKLTK